MNEILNKWDLTKIQKEVSIIQKNNKFTVLDIETTGFDPKEGAEIIQFAATKVEENTITDRLAFFVKPEKPVPRKITELTGITNEDVKKGVQASTAMWLIKTFIEDTVVVCHNARFDWFTFIKPMFETNLITVDNEVVCTYRTFQRAIPGLGKGAYTNERMASLFGYFLTDAHRADADVEATAHSLMGLKRWFDQVDLEEIIREKKEKDSQERKKKAKAKETFEEVQEDTPVNIKEVNFWEKRFGRKHLKRQYIQIENVQGSGTVFYDLINKKWGNKDFPSKLNFNSVERDTLKHLGLSNIQELENYRNEKSA